VAFEQAIWRIDEGLTRLTSASMAKEVDLERYIAADVSILNANWLIIGRQVPSDVGPIDLLAIDRSGALIVIELKRQQTTRDITAQALDYASWVDDLTSDEIAGIYKRYCDRWRPEASRTTLDQAFSQRFGAELPIEELNSSHQIVLVASELDPRTERIVRYLAKRGVEMNILFFQVFAEGDRRYLSRVWMLDAVEIEDQVSRARVEQIGEWNGEFYASFGVWDPTHRDWEEARRYGFISAGGGRWYSNTLQLLTPRGRVWVKAPGKGYVGVAEVIGSPQKASEFVIHESDGRELPFVNVSSTASYLRQFLDDDDKTEYFVPVRWIKTLSLDKGINEVGLFGNQNSVCKPTTPKWAHTVERLKQLFQVD